MTRRLFVLLAIVVGLTLARLGSPSEVMAKRSHAPATGLRTVAFAKAPPDFTFDDGMGPTHLAALTGKPVILSFWATWCEPCRAELPAFGHLRETYGDTVTLLTISDEPAGAARAFLQSRHLDLPVVEDPARKIFEAYSVTPIPVTIVLRPDGAVSYVSIGQTSYDELQAAVAAALTGQE
jgi:cytochrome c biogenesis protein CcmG/thiol:disulfide interchange protein DsbE